MRLQDEREKKRKEKNEEILERMRQGDPLCDFDKMESFYPIRPTIKKDKKAIRKLYRQEDEEE